MEFVYSANEGLVQNRLDGGTVMMVKGDTWWADDPFVLARPELFSSTPLVVHSTTGRPAPDPTPLDVRVEIAGVDVTSFVRRGRPRKLA